MSTRQRQEVDASEFYAAKRLRCPLCAASATVSTEELVVKASDVIFDQCPRCEAVVLIDMSRGTLARGKVGFEAFADAASAFRAATELVARQQQSVAVTGADAVAGALRGAVAIPGAFELLEAGLLNASEPRFAELERAGNVRRGTRNLTERSRAEEMPRWHAFFDRLRGYRRDELLVDGELVWLPLLELVSPVGVKGACSRKVTAGQEDSLGLKVLGAGFGSSASVSVSTQLAFTTAGEAVGMMVPLRVTAVRYVHDHRDPLVRVDAAAVEDRVRLERVPHETLPQPLRPPHFELLKCIELSRMTGAETFTWTGHAERKAVWSWSLGAVVPSLGDSSIGVSVERIEETEVSFELPYGRDYLIYRQTGRSPILPRCTVAPPQG